MMKIKIILKENVIQPSRLKENPYNLTPLLSAKLKAIVATAPLIATV